MDSLYSRYAQALLSIALEDNKVEYYKKEIKMLKELFNDNPDILHLLSSYFIDEKDKEDIIDKFYPNNQNIANFIKIVVKNKRIRLIDKIFEQFIEDSNVILHIKEGIVYSVNPLSQEQIKGLEKALSSKLDYIIELENKIDTRLIGGIKIVIEDKVYDGSVRSKLNQMKESLINGGL